MAQFACICVTSFCSHQTPVTLAEQILSPPDTGPLLFVPVPTAAQGSSSEGFKALERSKKHRTLRLQNCFLWEVRAEFQKVLHALKSESAGSCQQVTGLAREWDSAVPLAAQEGLTSSVLELFCYFRLGNSIEGIFCVWGFFFF